MLCRNVDQVVVEVDVAITVGEKELACLGKHLGHQLLGGDGVSSSGERVLCNNGSCAVAIIVTVRSIEVVVNGGHLLLVATRLPGG